jgi:GT2 family glycosyltransferase
VNGPAAVSVVVPVLTARPHLIECLASLERQTLREHEVVVVDNSGGGAVRGSGVAARFRFRLIENPGNMGYGAAINQGIRLTSAPYVAALNDDTVVREDCLERLIGAMERDPRAGMAAPRILMRETTLRLDSAGMLIARDGSSVQRGHGAAADAYGTGGPALCPSGCAALYRRAMLDQTGLFDEDYFLYCEDTDLGLRAQWAGWSCLYVAGAVVEHRYSESAGRASALKAYLVERNRLRMAAKLFPPARLAAAPLYALARYGWHAAAVFRGRGKASEFSRHGGAWRLAWYVLKAHASLLAGLGRVAAQRRAAPRRISSREFGAVLDRFNVPVKEVARH